MYVLIINMVKCICGERVSVRGDKDRQQLTIEIESVTTLLDGANKAKVRKCLPEFSHYNYILNEN